MMPGIINLKMGVVDQHTSRHSYRLRLSYSMTESDWNSDSKWNISNAWATELYEQSDANHVDLIESRNQPDSEHTGCIRVDEIWSVTVMPGRRDSFNQWITVTQKPLCLPNPKPTLKSRILKTIGVLT